MEEEGEEEGGGRVRRGWRPWPSQALLGQRGGHLVGQRGQLGGVGHVDAAGGRDGAQLLRGVFQRDDLGAVVSAGLGHLAEVQLVALNLSRWEGPQSHSQSALLASGLATLLKAKPKQVNK